MWGGCLHPLLKTGHYQQWPVEHGEFLNTVNDFLAHTQFTELPTPRGTFAPLPGKLAPHRRTKLWGPWCRKAVDILEAEGVTTLGFINRGGMGGLS